MMLERVTPPAGVQAVKTMGLDLALSASGLVVLETWLDPVKQTVHRSLLHHETIKTPADLPPVQRARMVRAKVQPLALQFTPEVTMIEAYAFGTPGAATHAGALGEVGGLVKDGLEAVLGYWHKEVPSTNAKKYGFGQGNLGQDHWLVAVLKRYEWDAPDVHQCIAIALADLAAADFLYPKEESSADLKRFPGMDAPRRDSLVAWRQTQGVMAQKKTKGRRR